jgi:phosphohistidine phosphatase
MSEYCTRLKFTIMKNLILIRHAKSNWDSPVNDTDLCSKGGVKDAHLVSSNVHDFLPKNICCI